MTEFLLKLINDGYEIFLRKEVVTDSVTIHLTKDGKRITRHVFLSDCVDPEEYLRFTINRMVRDLNRAFIK